MNWKLIYLTLLLSSVVFVQSTSYIEVDESGNEFEVKRFHIQGRQLNDKNQQCVITRRKRSPNTKSGRQYSNSDSILTLTAEEETDINNYSNAKDKIDDNDRADDIQIMKEAENQTISLQPPNMLKDQIEDESEEDEKIELIPNVEKMPESMDDNVPAKENQKKDKKEKIQKVTLIRPHSSEDTGDELENEEHTILQIVPTEFLSNTAANNFVIVQAQPQPQKVSAINSVLNVLPTEEDYGAQAELLPFSWSYENQPISTTAIWSTGDNVANNVFNRIKNSDISGFDQEDELDELEIQRPTRINRNKNKKKNQKQNKNQTIRYPANRPIRKKQVRPVKQIVRRKYHNGASPQNANKSRKRNQQSNKKKHNKNRATPLAITSQTMITTIDDDPQIECIIINKDTSTSTSTTSTTTSTTRRPFWNILGRQTTNVEQPRNYGLRKRTSLRFVA